jgi:hypothetical protein
VATPTAVAATVVALVLHYGRQKSRWAKVVRVPDLRSSYLSADFKAWRYWPSPPKIAAGADYDGSSSGVKVRASKTASSVPRFVASFFAA